MLRGAIVFALALVAGLAGAPTFRGEVSAEAPERSSAGGDGVLRIGMTQYPSGLHPAINSMLAKSYVLGFATRPVTVYDQNWELTCLLCEELPTLENGGAELTVFEDGSTGIKATYTLVEGLTWGDGEPVTAQDVIFSWEVGKHPRSGVTSGEFYRRILDITAHDERRFTVTMDRVQYTYNAFGLTLLPEHIERPIFEANPDEYRNRTAFDSDTTNPGLYLGPYRVSEVEFGSRIILRPNPYWNGRPPGFDRIEVRVIENTAAMEANLLSGSLDMVAGELGLRTDQALLLEEREGERFHFRYQPGLFYEHIDLNLDNPILADPRVRRALLHGIDRGAITSQLFSGRQPIAHSSISPMDAIHHPYIAQYDYDPERAAELLDAAGWDHWRGGLRHNAQGERLRLMLMTTAGDRSRERVQQVIQSQLRELGVDLRIRNEPARVFFGQTVSRRNFGGMAMFAWLSSPESSPRTVLHSSMIPSEETNWSGQNYTGYNSERMDSLIDRIEVELDPEVRAGLWAELQELYAEDLPALPLYWRSEAYILPRWLGGLRPTGHQFPSSIWVEDWYRIPGQS